MRCSVASSGHGFPPGSGIVRLACTESILDEVTEVLEFDGEVDVVDHDFLGDLQDQRDRLKEQQVALSDQLKAIGRESKQLVRTGATLAKKGGLPARRAVVAQFPNEPLVVTKLFDEIAPKYSDRTSGYTRIVKIGQRHGDGAEVVQIELV